MEEAVKRSEAWATPKHQRTNHALDLQSTKAHWRWLRSHRLDPPHVAVFVCDVTKVVLVCLQCPVVVARSIVCTTSVGRFLSICCRLLLLFINLFTLAHVLERFKSGLFDFIFRTLFCLTKSIPPDHLFDVSSLLSNYSSRYIVGPRRTG